MNVPTSVTEGRPLHARFDGPIVMIGFGSIGKGTLPLIERHFEYDTERFVIIDPHEDGELAKQHGVRFIKQAITKDNYREVLVPLLTAGGGQGFCVNLSVDTSSVDIMTLCREIGALYIDTVVEPWLGFYFDKSMGPEKRSNYALRETLLAAKHKSPGGPTAVSTCGANPGMVSWFVKQALLDVARDTGVSAGEPRTRDEWAALMRRVGIKGVHVAERDTQRAKTPKPRGKFVNTWSVEGLVSEGLQPAELGFGTHEKGLPPNGYRHDFGSGAAGTAGQSSSAPSVASDHKLRSRKQEVGRTNNSINRRLPGAVVVVEDPLGVRLVDCEDGALGAEFSQPMQARDRLLGRADHPVEQVLARAVDERQQVGPVVERDLGRRVEQRGDVGDVGVEILVAHDAHVDAVGAPADRQPAKIADRKRRR